MTCKDIYYYHASGAEEVVLLEAYRDVPLDNRDEIHDGNTALHIACYFTNIKAVDILLERGADVNVKMIKETLRYVSWQSVTPVRMMLSLPILRNCFFPMERRSHGPERRRPL